MKALLMIATGVLIVAIAHGQTISVPVPAQVITVPVPAQTVVVPAQTIKVPASTVQYTVPPYVITVPAGGSSSSGGGSSSSSSSSSGGSSSSSSSSSSGGSSSSSGGATPPTGNCGMILGGPATFCETFDTPAGVAGTRTGDLNPNVWGVSRTIGAGVNFGQSQYGVWNETVIQKCDGSTPTVNAPGDVIICNGQLREAVNDNNSLTFDSGDVTDLAMYPKQPFDFAGRTGTVSFDVSNDSTGTHSVWPEFWMSDLPVPAPFNHFNSWEALPANGLAVRLGNVAPPGQWGTCPNGNNLSQMRWTVDSAAVVRNYVLDDTNGYGPGLVKMTALDCVIRSSGPGNMNHVEIRISQGEIDVYATDAGVAATATTLRHIATITSAGLSFTRGLVWLEDVHYNADKETTLESPPLSATQRQHTFSWDNLAFDGPFTFRDFSFDAPNNNAPLTNGAVSLGRFSLPNQSSTWNISSVPANPSLAAAALVLFDFSPGCCASNPTTINVTVNGHAHPMKWPYPDNSMFDWRTLAVPIALTDLVAGTNVVTLGTDVAMVFANVDIVLHDVAGGVPVLPGSNQAYP